MAAGAVGGSNVPDDDDTMEDTLACLLDVPGCLSIEPDLLVRFADDGGGMLPLLPRGLVVFWDMLGLMGTLRSIRPSGSRILPSPDGNGNCVSLKSVEADSILVCRSSKLTEGRKSKESVEWFERPASPCRSNERPE